MIFLRANLIQIVIKIISFTATIKLAKKKTKAYYRTQLNEERRKLSVQKTRTERMEAALFDDSSADEAILNNPEIVSLMNNDKSMPSTSAAADLAEKTSAKKRKLEQEDDDNASKPKSQKI